MVNKSYVVVGVIFAVIIGLSGCTSKASGANTDQAGGFIGGNAGVSLELVGLKETMIMGSPLTLSAKVTNIGEYPIQADALELKTSTMDKNNWGMKTIDGGEIVFPIKNDRQLPAAAKTPEGEVYYPGMIQKTIGKGIVPSVAADSPVSLSVDACYPYTTKAILPMCISSEDYQGSCAPNANIVAQNSAAPLHVTDVWQSVAVEEDKAIYTLLITVKSDDTLTSECWVGSLASDEVKLSVSSEAAWANKPVECDSEIILQEGKTTTFSCNVETALNPKGEIYMLTLYIGGYYHTIGQKQTVNVLYKKATSSSQYTPTSEGPISSGSPSSVTGECVAKSGALDFKCSDILIQAGCMRWSVQGLPCIWAEGSCRSRDVNSDPTIPVGAVCASATTQELCASLNPNKCEWK